jgi:ADP-heptose:LPS heptosyltransferase
MTARVLFLIRGKLGDSLTIFSALQQFLACNPDTRATLAIRRDYATLVAADWPSDLLTFGNRGELVVKLLWRRLCGQRYDVLAILWGFGSIVETLARLSGAPRRIYMDGRRPAYFPEWPAPEADQQIYDPAWRVLRVLDPSTPRPSALLLPGLARRRAPTNSILVVPFADERRKSFDGASCRQWVDWVRSRHPGAQFRILVNPRDLGAAQLGDIAWPSDVTLETFTNLDQVLAAYATAAAWYGVDTGLYHLAVAMGLPSWVMFGPTRPRKIVMPQQHEATWVRLGFLDDNDCEEKGCSSPYCLHQALAGLTSGTAVTALAQTPAACPLRAASNGALSAVAIVSPAHENTHYQA